jgi:2-polyprenyl-6-methoxyphenol hydroxylase-like FAD-dependent oxidoreductase
VPEVQEVGVGLTILPHAVILLSELGIFDALDKESIRTEYMQPATQSRNYRFTGVACTRYSMMPCESACHPRPFTSEAMLRRSWRRRQRSR